MNFPELRDRFDIIREVSLGTVAVVFHARDRRSGDEVALKVCRGTKAAGQALMERFRWEVEAQEGLRHQAIVPVLDSCLERSPEFFTLPWLPGGDLARVIAQGGVSKPEAVAAGVRIAEALGYLHGQGLLHRDLKPENLLRDGEGRVYLMDLGLGRAQLGEGFTKTGSLVGTPLYMAPELYRGEDYTPQSDLFALGVTLAQLVSGRPLRSPAANPEVRRVLLAAVKDPDLRGILGWAIEQDPIRRPADGEALARALKEGHRPEKSAPEDEDFLTERVSTGQSRPIRKAPPSRTAPPPRKAHPKSQRFLAGAPIPRRSFPVGGAVATLLVCLLGGMTVAARLGSLAPRPAAPTAVPAPAERERWLTRLGALTKEHRDDRGRFVDHQALVLREYLDPRLPLRYRRMFDELQIYLAAIPGTGGPEAALVAELEGGLWQTLHHLHQDFATATTMSATGTRRRDLPESSPAKLSDDQVESLTSRLREVGDEVERAVRAISILRNPDPGPLLNLKNFLYGAFDVDPPPGATLGGLGLAEPVDESQREAIRRWNGALTLLPNPSKVGTLKCSRHAAELVRCQAFVDSLPAPSETTEQAILVAELGVRWLHYTTICGPISGSDHTESAGRVETAFARVERDLSNYPEVAAIHSWYAAKIIDKMSFGSVALGLAEAGTAIHSLHDEARRRVDE